LLFYYALDTGFFSCESAGASCYCIIQNLFSHGQMWHSNGLPWRPEKWLPVSEESTFCTQYPKYWWCTFREHNGCSAALYEHRCV